MSDTDTDIERFILQVVDAAGPDGITETDMMRAVSTFGEMLEAAAIIDLWRTNQIRALGWADDDLIWVTAEGSK